ncbi:MAG: sugar phosphate isomerase/epimerase, partial [Clostridia bacterium]|nr:sugar phosphate isomerase/epimerase [Clostridia bacterium]
TLEKLADLCAGRGITLQYHNHDFEYEMQDGERIMDYLLRANSSYLFELDTFWAGYAGVDPVKYMQELGERVQMIHIKDYLGIKDGEHRFAAIGTGTMDNAPIIRSARDMNKQWVIVELDNSPLTPMESARISIDNVRRILADDK